MQVLHLIHLNFTPWKKPWEFLSIKATLSVPLPPLWLPAPAGEALIATDLYTIPFLEEELVY